MTTAIVLAGGEVDPEWSERAGVSQRALVSVAGVPMYQRVVDALRQVPEIAEIIVVGAVPEGEGYRVVAPQESLLANVRRGLEESHHESVLFATADTPFLTPESVRFFLEASLQSGAVLTYAVVPAAVCREKFPHLPRTTVRLREGEVTGGNLFWAQRSVALRELPRLEALHRARKHPLKLAWQLGLGLLVRFVLAQKLSPRWLGIEEIERRAARILSVPVKAILTPYAEVGTDIDRLEHWMQVK
ncbi:MAG: nucleotidyltransferase family protein [Armatimonadetes bacterium]|nr:nucleotidyltransferase family protein [Armatimonadota bacterium]CUU38039.1 MobA-like NTP transferase domain-containing protein [Armatimonadetes bacterium DC]